MSVTHVDKDPQALTLTVTCDFPQPVARAWQLWSDPRQLERWWGPPGWPATFVDHALTPGSHVDYFMTGPEGQKSRAWWKIRAVEAQRSLTFDDGFSREDGSIDDAMPVMVMTVTLEARGSGTRMVLLTRFPDLDAMEKVLAMGMEEGMTSAMCQMDAVIAS